MIRYKFLAAAISVVVAFVDEISLPAAAESAVSNAHNSTRHGDSSKTEAIAANTSAESITVSASIYFPEPEQTDDTPFITADGSVINERNPGKHRWIALSRDLLSRWGGDIDYGDKVMVTGISDELDGLYEVHDTMHSRITNRIDILVGRQDNIMGFWDEIQITKVN